jgi:hypothetical protein
MPRATSAVAAMPPSRNRVLAKEFMMETFQ